VQPRSLRVTAMARQHMWAATLVHCTAMSTDKPVMYRHAVRLGKCVEAKDHVRGPAVLGALVVAHSGHIEQIPWRRIPWPYQWHCRLAGLGID